MNTKTLKQTSGNLRQDIIKSVYWAQSGHPWWSLSAIDLMTVLFYWGYLKYDPENPDWKERDYFVMSKWHWSPAYYAVLADLGYFSKDELFSFRQIDSLLQWHPSSKIPWVEISTWSLWQWLSVAVWISMWLKIDDKPNKVWALCWDWELQEWQIWEAAMTAAHYKCWNLVAIIDRNWLQIDGPTEEVMNVGQVEEKFKAFWWEVFDVWGHDISEIWEIYEKAIEVKDKPVAIIAYTMKWKWVSFMEDQAGWHWKAPSKEQYEKAIQEIWN